MSDIIELNGLFTIHKKDANGYWYVFHTKDKSRWMYCHMPLSYPLTLHGLVRKAGNTYYIELTDAKKIGQGVTHISHVNEELEKQIKINCVIKFEREEGVGFWYKAIDHTGSIGVFSKKKLWVKARLRLIDKVDYYWVETPHLSVRDVETVYLAGTNE